MEGMWKKMNVNPFHNLCLKLCMTGGFFVIASMTSIALAVSNASPNILMILTSFLKLECCLPKWVSLKTILEFIYFSFFSLYFIESRKIN